MISKLPNVEDEQNQSEIVHVKPAEPLAEESDETSQVLILVLSLSFLYCLRSRRKAKSYLYTHRKPNSIFIVG